LYDNGTQEFLAKVIKSLPVKVEEAPADEENRKFKGSTSFAES
jgi:26S proteasome regulatory subunit N2